MNCMQQQQKSQIQECPSTEPSVIYVRSLLPPVQILIFQHSALFPGNIAWNNTPSLYFQFPLYPLDIWATSHDVSQAHLWPLGTCVIKAISTQIWLIFQCLPIHLAFSSRLGKVSYQSQSESVPKAQSEWNYPLKQQTQRLPQIKIATDQSMI